MPQSGPSGSVRGALSNERPYRDRFRERLAQMACKFRNRGIFPSIAHPWP
jgi:hypothetical protein